MQRPLATVVIGGVISAMVMSLLVIRVLYVVFDEVGAGLAWMLRQGFGLRTEQLSWLLGGHGDEGQARRDAPRTEIMSRPWGQ